MAQKLTAAIPPAFDLSPNYIIRVTAVDPASGNTVTGVNVSNVSIFAAPVTPGTADEAATLVPVAPLWLPDEVAPLSGGGG
jgi:hypothetical protein